MTKEHWNKILTKVYQIDMKKRENLCSVCTSRFRIYRKTRKVK